MNSSTKAAPMTKDETMLLVQLVAADKIINNKATNATNNRLKEQAWQTLTNHFNSSVTSFPRMPSQLRLKWENLKKSARKRCANMKSSRNKTGGAKRKHKMEEEKCKARIFRENALGEYLLAKKKKIDLENEEKEIVLAKLKLELDNARLENLKLKADLNIV